jgi:hypothetical protein
MAGFGVERQKIGCCFRKIKYIQNQSYQNMSIIKVNIHFCILQQKKIVKNWLIFDLENQFVLYLNFNPKSNQINRTSLWPFHRFLAFLTHH